VKRLVRLHLDGQLPSIEGLLHSYRTSRSGGHYVVEVAKVVEGESASVTLEGRRALVPRERVVFVQELR
jgi:hypothetical protein